MLKQLIPVARRKGEIVHMTPIPRTFALPANRAVVMGVVNVTPDSFSDGGRAMNVNDAVNLGCRLAADGADIVDIGGESTRPGAQRVPPAVESDRVLPVISELARKGIVCSVDTTRASVASAALDAGAFLVNDVSGGLADPDMAPMIAAAGVPWILTHSRGPSAAMDTVARYHDVVAQVHNELMARVEAAVAAGVDESLLVLDPGLGFAKTAAHNWAILRALPRITGLEQRGWGFPVLIGASRKRFLGELLADPAGLRPIDSREDATTTVSALCAAAGVWGVRVHTVTSSVDAVRVAAAITGHAPRRTLPGCLDDNSGAVR
jgi:dihydropteroate synthase